MPDKVWKKRERQVARWLGVHRRRESGAGWPTGEDDDMVHPTLYVEHKHRRKQPAIELCRRAVAAGYSGLEIAFDRTPDNVPVGIFLLLHSSVIDREIATADYLMTGLLKSIKRRAFRPLHYYRDAFGKSLSSKRQGGNFKTPVVTLSQHGTQGFWLFFYLGDLKEIVRARKEAMASAEIGERCQR